MPAVSVSTGKTAPLSVGGWNGILTVRFEIKGLCLCFTTGVQTSGD